MEKFADVLDLAQAHLEQETALAIAEIRALLEAPSGRTAYADCGEPIPRTRLKHLPSARRCVDCQDRYERRWPASARGHATI
jgi:phage/conjugal plasmid C-4 type zinc finger TraR family protein